MLHILLCFDKLILPVIIGAPAAFLVTAVVPLLLHSPLVHLLPHGDPLAKYFSRVLVHFGREIAHDDLRLVLVFFPLDDVSGK